MIEGLVADLIAELDTDRNVSDLPKRSQALVSVVQAWQDSDRESELPSQVKWELAIHDMMTVPRRRRQSSPDGWFAPMMTGFDDSTDPPTEIAYPDVADLLSNEQAVAYYRLRAGATPNPIRRARYADFTWLALQQQHEPDAFRFGLTAADAYLDLSLLHTRA